MFVLMLLAIRLIGQPERADFEPLDCITADSTKRWFVTGADRLPGGRVGHVRFARFLKGNNDQLPTDPVAPAAVNPRPTLVTFIHGGCIRGCFQCPSDSGAHPIDVSGQRPSIGGCQALRC